MSESRHESLAMWDVALAATCTAGAVVTALAATNSASTQAFMYTLAFMVAVLSAFYYAFSAVQAVVPGMAPLRTYEHGRTPAFTSGAAYLGVIYGDIAKMPEGQRGFVYNENKHSLGTSR